MLSCCSRESLASKKRSAPVSALQAEGLGSGKGVSAKNGPEAPWSQLCRGNRPLPMRLSFDPENTLQSRYSFLPFYK